MVRRRSIGLTEERENTNTGCRVDHTLRRTQLSTVSGSERNERSEQRVRAEPGRRRQKLTNEAHKSDIFAVEATGNYTITGSGDGQILLWKHNERDPKKGISLKASAAGIHHLSTDGSGRWLIAASFDGKAVLYDLENVEQEGLELVSDVWAVALAPTGRYLVVSKITGEVIVFDISTITESGSESESADVAATIKQVQLYKGNGGVLGLSVDFASDDEHIVVGYENGAIHVYSIKTGRLEYSLTGHSNPIRAVKFSPKATLLAIGGDSKLISLYSMVSGEHITNLTGSDGWIFSLDWNETGEYLLSTSYDGRSRVWWIESRACVANQNDSSEPLFGCKWLKKGWGVGVIGGVNQGFATVGVDKSLRWYREAAGN